MRGLSLVCGMVVIAGAMLAASSTRADRRSDSSCKLSVRVAVAATVVVVIEAVAKARHETPTAEMPLVAEVAADRGEVLTRNAASETGASTAEMGAAKAADMSATTEPADMSATAEASTVSTAEATTPAARKRISGQSGGESGSRRQDDHGLT